MYTYQRLSCRLKTLDRKDAQADQLLSLTHLLRNYSYTSDLFLALCRRIAVNWLSNDSGLTLMRLDHRKKSLVSQKIALKQRAKQFPKSTQPRPILTASWPKTRAGLHKIKVQPHLWACSTHFFLWCSRIRVDLLSYESKPTDKRLQNDWRAEKNLDGCVASEYQTWNGT